MGGGFFKPLAITSIEYYEEQEEQSQDEADALTRPNRHGGRDEVAYYQDNGAGESKGVWLTLGSASTLDPALPPLLSPTFFGDDGTTVEGRHLRDLAIGRHPLTKEPLVDHGPRDKRRVGFDVTMAAPKSVSVYASASPEAIRARVFDAHDRAVRKAMQVAFDKGLIITRESARDPTTGKKIYFGQPVRQASAAVYRHFTSRSLDPQLHSHVVLLNVAVRPDGKTGAINDTLLNAYNGFVGVIYRTELASILRDELGLECVQDGRNFEIAGVDEKVIKTFSKRRAEIEKIAAEKGFSTALDRRKAEIAALESRSAKDKDVALSELEAIWDAELRRAGWDRESLMEATQAAAREAAKAAPATEDKRAEEIRAAIREAVAGTFRNDSVVEARIVERVVLETLQTRCTVNESLALLEGMVASGDLIQIGEKGKRAVFSTREIIEAERAMLAAVRGRIGERDFVSAEAIERAIRKRDTIREDQAAAVRHALNRDGVSVVEGSAGSGKSFSLGAVKEVAEACGLKTWTLAPSWKATEVVRQDTGNSEEFSRAVAGFVNRVATGKIQLTAKDVIVVDEAGMVGLREMSALVTAAEKAGAKLVLVGDTRQLQPVVAGAPMRAIARAVGSQRITEITRQTIAWQQAASKDFAAGEARRALEAYDKAGRVRIMEDRDAMIAQLVRDYVENRKRPTFLTNPDGKPVTRAILTGWNEDVRAINAAIREEGKRAGWIGEEDWTIRVLPRGSTKAAELAFSVGDDVIFGETVELAGQTLRNADLGRIERIEGDPADPTLTIALAKAKGETITVRASQLVGRREEGQEAVPMLQHAAAMTIHASQGVTVDHAFVANLRGMGQESTYVAMTRHRHSVRYYADADRIHEQIDGAAIKLGRNGGAADLAEQGDRNIEAMTAQEVKDRIFAEATRGDQKENASDYMSVDAFLSATPARVAKTVARDAERPPVAAIEPPRPAEEAQAVPTDAPRPIPSFKLDLSMKRPVGITSTKAAAFALRKHMEDRMSAPTRYPVPQPSRPEPRGRITEEEFKTFRRIDLAAFAEREGMVPIGKAAIGKRGEEYRLYQDPSKPDGSKVNIAQWPNGDWSFVTRDGTASGDITKFLAWKRGGSSIQAAHELRRHYGTGTPAEPRRLTPEAPAVRKPAAEARDERLSREEKAKAQRLFRINWQRMSADVNQYLVKDRGISPEILARFRSEIRTEPNDPTKPWFKGGTACFAHRDLDGNLVGYERKGEEWQDDGKRSFSRMVKGSDKAFTMLGETRTPSRIYVAESAVEALSVYQRDGQPADALLCSPYGNPSDEAVAQFAELARRHPNAEIRLAFNNDASGEKFTRKFRAAVAEARGDDARIVEQAPDPAYKDWNDQIRNITKEKAEELKAERLRKEAEERARREAEEAAIRQQQEQKAVRAYVPKLVPR